LVLRATQLALWFVFITSVVPMVGVCTLKISALSQANVTANMHDMGSVMTHTWTSFMHNELITFKEPTAPVRIDNTTCTTVTRSGAAVVTLLNCTNYNPNVTDDGGGGGDDASTISADEFAEAKLHVRFKGSSSFLKALHVFAGGVFMSYMSTLNTWMLVAMALSVYRRARNYLVNYHPDESTTRQCAFHVAVTAITA
jgi:hypothetical protein